MSAKTFKPCAYEWPTLGLLALVYICFALILINAGQFGLLISIALLTPLVTLHSSLQHELIHTIEQRHPMLAQILVFPAVGLFIPYLRFRDQHLAHHRNENLTDPIDDPESFYLAPEIWRELPAWKQMVLRFNNTLIGRILIGPIVGQLTFMAGDWCLWRKKGDRAALIAWAVHIPAVALVVWYVGLSSLPFWAYFIAAYLGLSILKIRTYLEHRAEKQANGRSVIIEDRGILAFLFLNNNYHAAHHAHPSVRWYHLPRLFTMNRKKFLGQNRGYYFRNYKEILQTYLFHAKEPVEHPLWSLGNRKAPLE
ncbi:MAG: fatty acid desaturase [Pseudomonadota bacterium]